MPDERTTVDSDLILRLLTDERDRIARAMDRNILAWEREPGYPWFDRNEWLSDQRIKLAQCNAAVARRLP